MPHHETPGFFTALGMVLRGLVAPLPPREVRAVEPPPTLPERRRLTMYLPLAALLGWVILRYLAFPLLLQAIQPRARRSLPADFSGIAVMGFFLISAPLLGVLIPAALYGASFIPTRSRQQSLLLGLALAGILYWAGTYLVWRQMNLGGEHIDFWGRLDSIR